MIEVGKMIAKVRNERGLSQQQLASKLHVSKQAVSNWERGKREPDYVTLEAIADILNAPITMFITTEDKDNALNEIYSTYDVQRKKSKEWRLLSEGMEELEKNNNAAFQAIFNFLTTTYPDTFKERNDDDANDPES